MKVNIAEVEKIIKEMESGHKSNPIYNHAAANIVKQGVQDKNQSYYSKSLPAKPPSPKLI